MSPLLYESCRVLARLILSFTGWPRVRHASRTEREGGYLLAANHLSHFDPPLVALPVPRRVEWLAMRELFGNRWVARCLRALGAIPTDRSEPDRAAVREALRRLKAGRVVGIFPEGGIRTGAESLLAGAPLRPGVAMLARMAGVPVIPCLVLGSEQYYRPSAWFLWPRTRVRLLYGEPVFPRTDLPPAAARAAMEAALQAGFAALLAEAEQDQLA